MKDKLKLLLRWFGAFVLCFLTIYLFVFFGGWRFFESGDPILIEIGVALVLSIFMFAINEEIDKLKKRIKSLEDDISKFDEKSSNR